MTQTIRGKFLRCASTSIVRDDVQYNTPVYQLRCLHHLMNPTSPPLSSSRSIGGVFTVYPLSFLMLVGRRGGGGQGAHYTFRCSRKPTLCILVVVRFGFMSLLVRCSSS